MLFVSSRWWGASLGPTITTAARETTLEYVLQCNNLLPIQCLYNANSLLVTMRGTGGMQYSSTTAKL